MKDSFVNILFFFSLTLLLISFFGKEPQKAIPTQPYFVASKTDLVVPNFPSLTLQNPTNQELNLNTCKQFSIAQNFSNTPVPLPKTFCRDISIPAAGSGSIDLSSLHELFVYPSATVFRASYGSGSEVILPIQVESPGLFRSFLSTIFYAPILNFFIAILTYLPGHSLGFGIIIITIFVRIILLYPQHKMLVNSRKMQDIAPKIKAIQDTHKGDQLQMGQALMKLYKDEGVSPVGSLLPLLIQLPLLIVLYWVISSLQDTSNRYFLYNPFENFQLEDISHIFYGIDLYGIGGTAGLILAGVVGFLQWLQLYLSYKALPKKEDGVTLAKTLEEAKKSDEPPSFLPDQALMQKMMMYIFPPMIAFTTFFFPAGLGIYMFVSTLFVIVQQQIVQMKKDL